MICAFIYLLIPFTAGRQYIDPRCSRNNYVNSWDMPQDCLKQRLHVDLYSGDSFFMNFENLFHPSKNRNHKTHCVIEVWQIIGSENRLLMLIPGIREFFNYFNLPKSTNLDHPLWIGTSCADGLWVDRFEWQLTRPGGSGYQAVADKREYGSDNDQGWCLSTKRFEWATFGANVPEYDCYKTVELQAFNNINRGSEGGVFGYQQRVWDIHGFGRRMLDSEPSANDFVPVLEQYHQCVNTLGDVPACDSLADAAVELFNADQGDVGPAPDSEEIDSQDASMDKQIALGESERLKRSNEQLREVLARLD